MVGHSVEIVGRRAARRLPAVVAGLDKAREVHQNANPIMNFHNLVPISDKSNIIGGTGGTK